MDAAKLGEFYDYVTRVKGLNGRNAMPPAYITDRPEWVERMSSSGKVVDGYFVYATTMSVLMPDSTSVAVTLFVLNPNTFEFIDQSATLRYSVGGLARIYGLSQAFSTSEEMGDEGFGVEDVEERGNVPFTAAMEREAIRQLADCLRAQFDDPDFQKVLSKRQKADALAALQRG